MRYKGEHRWKQTIPIRKWMVLLSLFFMPSFFMAQVVDTEIFKQRPGDEQKKDGEAGKNSDGSGNGNESQEGESVGNYPLKATFVKKAETLPSGVMFFNVLKIENPTDQPQKIKVRFSYPERCNLLLQPGDDGVIEIQPGKKKFMPVRIAFPTDVNGGVEYPIQARVSEESGEELVAALIKTQVVYEQNCKWLFTTPRSKIFVGDNSDNFTELGFKLKNSGNCAEVIELEFRLGAKLESPLAKLGKIKMKVPVIPSTDTVVVIDVRCKGFSPEPADLKIIATASSPFDTVDQELGISFDVLDDEFRKELKEDLAPLIISTNQGGLGEDASTNFAAYGTILLKGDRDLSYRFETAANLMSNKPLDAKDLLWTKARMYATYSTPNYRFSVGDVSGGNGISVSGRGLKIDKGFGQDSDNKKMRLGLTLVKNVNSAGWGLATTFDSKVNERLSLSSGFTYKNDPTKGFNTVAPTAGFNARIGENARIAASGVFTSQSEIGRNTDNLNGFGGRLDYNYSKDNLKIKASTTYGSQNLANGDAGGLKLNAGADYAFENAGRIGISYNKIQTLMTNELETGETIKIGHQSTSNLRAAYNVTLGKLALGASIDDQMNRTKNETMGGEFFTGQRTYKLGLGTKFKINNENEKYFAPMIAAGATHLTRTNLTDEVKNPMYYFAKAGIRAQYRNLGFNTVYDYGLKQGMNNVFFDEAEGGIYAQSLKAQLNYSYESADEKFSFYSDANLDYRINEQVADLKLTAKADYQFDNGWSFNLGLGSTIKDFLSKKKKNSGRGGAFSIANMVSVNAGAKKVFDFDQPRVKFYNIQLSFFKDANGNKEREKGEEGIANVLVKVERAKDPVMTDQGPQIIKFKPPNIMSNEKGMAELLKAPQGTYLIELEELFMMTDFANLQGFNLEVVLNQHKKILVPYSKSVNIVGKVKITRDKYSRLFGITPANIRVTVEDQNGDLHYALTSSNGSYMVTVPYSEEYKISMKNVLGKKFELIGQEQVLKSEEGKSRYEIGFHFKEKGRSISFN
ncbi:MAG: hypothetical protein AAFY71_15340 [Bacteroidota bacterium]